MIQTNRISTFQVRWPLLAGKVARSSTQRDADINSGNSQSGFTLVELIAATTLLCLLVIGIANLWIIIETTQRKSYHLEVASRAGEKEIESLRNSQYSNLTPNSTIDFSADLPDDLPDPSTGTVDVSEPEIGIRRVDVTITYKDGSKTKTIKQSSFIGIIGIGQ